MSLLASILGALCFVLATVCVNQVATSFLKQSDHMYSINGNIDNKIIVNGSIILTGNHYIFDGGTFIYNGENIDNVTNILFEILSKDYRHCFELF